MRYCISKKCNLSWVVLTATYDHFVQFSNVLITRKWLLCLALNSSEFLHHADNNWCATVGIYNNEVNIYENHWTDDRHYICQYNCE